MPTNLSISNAPDPIVRRLRERAKRHDRSLRDEMLAIIEAAMKDDAVPELPSAILADIRNLGLGGPSEATAIVRADRDRG